MIWALKEVLHTLLNTRLQKLYPKCKNILLNATSAEHFSLNQIIVQTMSLEGRPMVYNFRGEVICKTVYVKAASLKVILSNNSISSLFSLCTISS